MRDVQKAFDSDSGPNYILDLDGPDGNVYYLWGLLKNLLGEETIEESKNAGHYTDPSKCPLWGMSVCWTIVYITCKGILTAYRFRCLVTKSHR